MAEVSLNTGVSQVRATSDVLYAAAKTKNLLRDAIIDQQGFEAILYSSFTDQNTRDLFGEISYNLQRTKTTIRFIPDFKQYMAAVDFYQAGAIRENEKIPLKAKVRSDLNIKTGDILSYAFSYFESTSKILGGY